MSLESALEANTAALLKLTEAYLKGQVPAADKPAATKDSKPAAAAKAPEKQPEKAADPVPADDKPLTYDAVGSLVVQYVKSKGKDAAMAILKEAGVETGKFIDVKEKPEFFKPVFDAFTKALAA